MIKEMKKSRIIKILMLLAMIICSICFAISTVHAAEFENPYLDPTKPYFATDEDGNQVIWSGEDTTTFTLGVPNWSNSKKGIQENDYRLDTDYQALGVKHILLNMVMNDCIEYQNGSYYLTNQSYVASYIPFVKKMNAEGVKVTLVILMRWDSNPAIQQLIYQGGREGGHSFYELNTQDAVGRQAWTNIFGGLASIFGQSDCYIENYILGNEVNQTGSNGYNYTGSTDLNTNVNAYTDSFLVLDQALRTYSPSSKAYISLDHNWTATDTGHAGKNFLDAFVSRLYEKDSNARWNLAWHPYAPSLRSTVNTSMDNLVIWNSSRLTNDLSTPYICGSNLTVLTDYIKNNWGSSHRVLLSEQGFDAAGGHESWQDAFIAYTFYAAQFNDMVDGVMFRSYIDNPDEDGLKFGLLSGSIQELDAASDRGAYIENHRRPSYDVFKYMDTELADQYTASCRQTIGISSWSQLFPAYTHMIPWNEGWNTNSNGEIFYVQNGMKLTGWQSIDGNQYYFYSNGSAAIGTPAIDGKKYWFDGSGAQKTGWLSFMGMELYFDPQNQGIAASGITTIDGTLYLFDDNGVKLKGNGTPIVGGRKYYLINGIITTGWLQLGQWKMYFDPNNNGAAAVGIITIDGRIYNFDSNGIMVSFNPGMFVFEGKKYYVLSDRTFYRGWLQLTPDWRLYFDENNEDAAATGLLEIDGDTYYFDSNGVMQKNVMPVVEGKKYFIQSNGKAKKGWLQLSQAWRLYCDPEAGGAVATGFHDIDGKSYYFDENGVMYSNGMPVINGKKYMIKKDGTVFKGWLWLTDDWKLYCNPQDYGAILTGMQTIDDDFYIFDSNGIMNARFTKEKDKIYCYNSDGKRYAGCTPMIGGQKFGFAGNGAQIFGWYQLGTYRFYFNPENHGAAATGNVWIDDVLNYFNSDGLYIGRL
ncbi:MAG: DUF5722 domain-containing protein [Lachnospiraceae bacterium]|nr:DUF5722 domain-containing protein [Lachnospiraceae bacterium]